MGYQIVGSPAQQRFSSMKLPGVTIFDLAYLTGLITVDRKEFCISIETPWREDRIEA